MAGGVRELDWFLYKKDGRTGIVTLLKDGAKNNDRRSMAPSSEDRFAVARAVRKSVFNRRSAKVVFLDENRGVLRRSRTLFRDQCGTKRWRGGWV